MPRTKLPDVRPSLTLRRQVCGFKCYFIVSFFDDGDRSRPAEVFCTIAKQGSVIGGLIDGLCRTISVSLQYGVTWPEIERGLLGHIFDRKEDPDHSSLLDGLAKAVNYLIDERKKVTGEDEPASGPLASTLRRVTQVGVTDSPAQEIRADRQVHSPVVTGLEPPMVGGIRDNPNKPGIVIPEVGLGGGPRVNLIDPDKDGTLGAQGKQTYEDGSTFYFTRKDRSSYWSLDKYERMGNGELFAQVTARNCGKFSKDTPKKDLVLALLREDGFSV